MKQKPKKLTNEQSFFLILLFVIGGFTIIMLNILSSEKQEIKTTETDLNNTKKSSENFLIKNCDECKITTETTFSRLVFSSKRCLL